MWSGLRALIQKKKNAYCKLCKCVISLSNMGEEALRSHADGNKQKNRLEDHEQVKNFFKPKNAIDITKEPSKTSEPVTITTPVDSVSAEQVQHHLMHPTLNHFMPVFKTQLAKRLELCGH